MAAMTITTYNYMAGMATGSIFIEREGRLRGLKAAPSRDIAAVMCPRQN